VPSPSAADRLDIAATPRLADRVKPIRFVGTIRYWDPAKGSGLAVIDITADHIPTLGGLRQQRVRGSLAGAAFASNVMPAGAGRLGLSVSKAMMNASHVAVGDEAEVEISGVGAG
jgi:hypothetical protein